MEFESKDGLITKYTVIEFFLSIVLLIATGITLGGITDDYENLEKQNENYFRLKELYEKVKTENNISYADGDRNQKVEREIYYQEHMNNAKDIDSTRIDLRLGLIMIYLLVYVSLYNLMKRFFEKEEKAKEKLNYHKVEEDNKTG